MTKAPESVAAFTRLPLPGVPTLVVPHAVKGTLINHFAMLPGVALPDPTSDLPSLLGRAEARVANRGTTCAGCIQLGSCSSLILSLHYLDDSVQCGSLT